MLPGNARATVSIQDWNLLSTYLHDKSKPNALEKLFYLAPKAPDDEGSDTSSSFIGQRRDEFLTLLNDDSYARLFRFIKLHPEISFPNIHKVTDLTRPQSSTLAQIFIQVVYWLNPDPAVITTRQGYKPGLHKDIAYGLQHLTAGSIQQIGTRSPTIAAVLQTLPPAPPSETGSLLLQHEVLDYIMNHLSAFRAKGGGALVGTPPDEQDNPTYKARFSSALWAGLLSIVRGYARPNFQQEWFLMHAKEPSPAIDRAQVLDLVLGPLQAYLAPTSGTQPPQVTPLPEFQRRLAELVDEFYPLTLEPPPPSVQPDVGNGGLQKRPVTYHDDAVPPIEPIPHRQPQPPGSEQVDGPSQARSVRKPPTKPPNRSSSSNATYLSPIQPVTPRLLPPATTPLRAVTATASWKDGPRTSKRS